LLGTCGDGRPREPALSEVEGSKPSAARQLPVVTATLDSLLAGGCAVRRFSRIRGFGGSDVLEKLGQALGVVHRLAETCGFVSARKPGDLLLQRRFLNGRDE